MHTRASPVSADAPLAVLRPARRVRRHQLLPAGQDDLPEDPVLRQPGGGEPQSRQIHRLPVQRPAHMVHTEHLLQLCVCACP